MERIRRETLTVRHHECGPDAKLKLNSLFDYLQDAAAKHADHLGVGIEFLARNRMLWVLSRLKLAIRRMPSVGETIEVVTYPSGPEKLFATRQYQVCGEDGTEIVQGSSYWLLLDAEKFRPLKPLQHLGSALPANEDQRRYFTGLEKITCPDSAFPRFISDVRHSMIDVNRHLNNAFYAAFLTDILGKLTGTFCIPSEFQINFNHSGALGDRILCGGALSADSIFHADGTSPDGTIEYFHITGTL